ncbi:A24 family peptidase [soil metagenome]
MAAACAVVGLGVGGVLTTVVARVPDRRALFRPGPRCGDCDVAIARRDLVPLASWVGLGRRCRACRAPITVAYPLVEVGTAALFAVAGVRFGATWVLVPFLVLFAFLVAVTAVDLIHYRIPDRLTFPTLAVSLPLIVAVSLIEGAPSAITTALIGSLVYFTILFIPHLISPQGMGFGDVKLALVLGLFVGWLAPDWLLAVQLVLFALVFGSVIGVVGGLVAMVARRRRGAFPFGPALAAGTVIVVLASNTILAGYT